MVTWKPPTDIAKDGVRVLTIIILMYMVLILGAILVSIKFMFGTIQWFGVAH